MLLARNIASLRKSISHFAFKSATSSSILSRASASLAPAPVDKLGWTSATSLSPTASCCFERAGIHRARTFLLPSSIGLVASVAQTCSSSTSPQDADKSGKKEVRLSPDRILTVPNLLCFARIGLSPYLVHLIVDRQYEWAFAVFVIAGITDLLDGYIARNFAGQASMLGSFLDPLADKILVASLFLSLTYAGVIPAALTSLVVSRDVLLVYAGLYIRYMGVKPPFTLKKYFDVTAPIAQVQPTAISKINTLVQLVLVGAALLAPVAEMQQHPAFYGLCGLTACTTFASAVSYAFMKDTYKFSHRSYDHQLGKKTAAFVFFIAFNLVFVNCFPVRPGLENGT